MAALCRSKLLWLPHAVVLRFLHLQSTKENNEGGRIRVFWVGRWNCCNLTFVWCLNVVIVYLVSDVELAVKIAACSGGSSLPWMSVLVAEFPSSPWRSAIWVAEGGGLAFAPRTEVPASFAALRSWRWWLFFSSSIQLSAFPNAKVILSISSL
jgi:hypothetical protein